METGPSICNRNRIMTGVKFLFRVTLRRHDLASEIYYVREPQKLPLTMSPAEAKRLLAMADKLKVKVMLALCYGCGLRAGEVCRLKAGDIDSELNIIRIVQAKGRKVRSTRYDEGVPLKELWLFPGRRRSQPLTTRQLSRLFHEAAEAAGIKKAVTLHSLRHSFATHLFEQGLDIRLIQAVLGHHKLDTTARYTRVATGRIAAIASPLDQLGGEPKHPKKKAKPRAA